MARHPILITGSTWPDKDYRPLSEFEKQLLLRICDQEFVGREEVLKQIEGLEAKQIDEHGAMGCLKFRVNSDAVTPMRMDLIAKSCFFDSDSRVVFLMLFVIDHKLFDLQIWKPADDEYEPVLRLPDPKDVLSNDKYWTGLGHASLRKEVADEKTKPARRGWFRRWFSLP